MTNCPLCHEIVIVGAHDISSLRIGGLLAHRECALRSVLGGIGHLTNHDLWCTRRHDPDAGLSYRASALRVSEYVTANGIERALAVSVHHAP